MSGLRDEVLEVLAEVGRPMTRAEIFNCTQTASEADQVSRVLWHLQHSGEVLRDKTAKTFRLADTTQAPPAPAPPPAPQVDKHADEHAAEHTGAQVRPMPTGPGENHIIECAEDEREARRIVLEKLDHAIEAHLRMLDDPVLDALLTARGALTEAEQP